MDGYNLIGSFLNGEHIIPVEMTDKKYQLQILFAENSAIVSIISASTKSKLCNNQKDND